MCSNFEPIIFWEVSEVYYLNVAQTFLIVHLSWTAEYRSNFIWVDSQNSYTLNLNTFRIHECLCGIDIVQVINQRIYVNIEI